MLAMMARAVPAIFMSSGLAAPNWIMPFSVTTLTPAGLAMVSVPFGPLTDRTPSASLNSTPLGIGRIFLATRDMVRVSLGDQAEDFAAHARSAGLAIGHQTLGGGDDGHAETGEDLRQLVLAAVGAQARTRHALEALDDRAALVVLQGDLELGLGAFAGDAHVADVALGLEDVGDRQLQLRSGHGHHRLADRERILDAHQHVGDGISHAH